MEAAVSSFAFASASDTSTSGKCVPQNFTKVSVPALWDWQGWIVIVDLFVLFVTLFMGYVPIEFAMVAASTILVAFQIITLTDATAGFSNTGVLAVVCLFVIAECLTSTGAVDYLFSKWLGRPKTLGRALVRMMIPSAFVAAWISSTVGFAFCLEKRERERETQTLTTISLHDQAVVALMIPIIARWGRKLDIPPSQLMLPLCYAVHLGGTCTLVGTTTNLVISGLASTYYCKTMGIFTLSAVGVPVAVAGLGFLLLFTPRESRSWLFSCGGWLADDSDIIKPKRCSGSPR